MRPAIANLGFETMPLMNGLLTFLQPVGWSFNVQNIDVQEFFIPIYTPCLLEH